jgi:hypothetical protein
MATVPIRSSRSNISRKILRKIGASRQIGAPSGWVGHFRTPFCRDLKREPPNRGTFGPNEKLKGIAHPCVSMVGNRARFRTPFCRDLKREPPNRGTFGPNEKLKGIAHPCVSMVGNRARGIVQKKSELRYLLGPPDRIFREKSFGIRRSKPLKAKKARASAY